MAEKEKTDYCSWCDRECPQERMYANGMCLFCAESGASIYKKPLTEIERVGARIYHLLLDQLERAPRPKGKERRG